ncbi:hypothetical protein PTTG_25401 [Puccinia triticina 1-1 BBBD Race 1]|uniref:Uncharacterized protein n=1 Tax=Puccinia triticina (isolate 1-1 / race 1 (BBBD)) TaxID=630390 RepID=A0A180H4D3_PUCT1|nr:hypothetical protein PTTG_25401 [Puccinia triticina 1-1 BBBD Race 1]
MRDNKYDKILSTTHGSMTTWCNKICTNKDTGNAFENDMKHFFRGVSKRKWKNSNNSASATVNSASATVNSASATVNSASATVNSASATVNSASATVNSASATVNSASATVNSGYG